jgi:hypothetical protein
VASWQDQFERLKRYLCRIRIRDRDRAEYEDDLLSFFQNCWHLKDWIWNDDSLTLDVRTEVRDAAHRHKALRVCRDIAIRSKHLELTKPSVGTGADIFGEAEVEISDSMSSGKSTSKVLWDYMVDIDGESVRALDVAEAAVGTWHYLFATHGMLKSTDLK